MWPQLHHSLLACLQAAMIEAGALPALTALLGRAQPDGQYAAAAALYNLTGQQAAVRLALLTLPALPHLVHMLQADSWSASSFPSCMPPLKSHVFQFQCAHVCVCLHVPACGQQQHHQPPEVLHQEIAQPLRQISL